MKYKLNIEINSEKELQEVEKLITDYINNNIGNFVYGYGEVLKQNNEWDNKFYKKCPKCDEEKGIIPRCMHLAKDHTCNNINGCCFK